MENGYDENRSMFVKRKGADNVERVGIVFLTNMN